MVAVESTDTVHVHHVEEFSNQDWEDETTVPAEGKNVGGAGPQGGKGKRRMSAVLRSSFNLRIASATERTPSKTEHGKTAGRGSTTGFVGTLLHGMANAIGLHREGSPAGDVSPSGSSTITLSGQPRNVPCLSSAADLRAEMRASLGQFGDLRNDSFSSPATIKLIRRGSQLRTSETGGVPTPTASGRAAFHTAASGDLQRHSTTNAGGALSGSQLPPGFEATRGSTPGNAPPSPCRRPRSAVPTDTPQEPILDSFGSVIPFLAVVPPQRSVSGAVGGVTGRVGSVTDMPRLQPSMAPHPPQQPRGPGVGLSPSRTTSTEHLPPMVSPGGSIRDRPPTPRGRTSVSGIGAVLGSLHLPDILSSGKSITERRSSVSGDAGAPRSRRNSVSGPPMVGVRSSGGSVVGLNGSIIQGPGGAAINASLAKRAAGVAADVVVPSPGSSACGTPVISPSNASSSTLPRAPGASRVTSSPGKPPVSSGILQDYHSSLELEEDSGLAAVDAEFDRRFCQPSAGGTRPETPLSGEFAAAAGGPRPASVRSSGGLQPHAPRTEKTSAPGNPRRSNPNAVPAFVNPSPNPTSPGEPPKSPFLLPHHPRRQSCAATMCAAPSSDADPVYGSSPDGGERVLMTSMDAIPTLSPPPTLDAKGRLASIRLSYAEGIVATHPDSPPVLSAAPPPAPAASRSRQGVSLDLPPAVPSKNPASAWSQSPQPPRR